MFPVTLSQAQRWAPPPPLTRVKAHVHYVSLICAEDWAARLGSDGLAVPQSLLARVLLALEAGEAKALYAHVGLIVAVHLVATFAAQA